MELAAACDTTNGFWVSSFSDRMKEARERAGLTQTEVADAIGARHHVVWRYENEESRPRAERLHKIARLLRCDPNWLLTGREPDAPGDSDGASPAGYAEFVETFGHLFDDDLVERLRGDVFGRFGLNAGEMTAKRYLELAQLLERAKGTQ